LKGTTRYSLLNMQGKVRRQKKKKKAEGRDALPEGRNRKKRGRKERLNETKRGSCSKRGDGEEGQGSVVGDCEFVYHQIGK